MDAAKRLLEELGENGPRGSHELPYNASWCVICETDTRGHTSDCPWLAMPRIVAALEAAERLLEARGHEEPIETVGTEEAQVYAYCGGEPRGPGLGHVPDCPHQAFVATLKGGA